MLEIRGLDGYYGAIQAIRAIDCEANGGEVVALVGLSGAGKSSILRAISGIMIRYEGSIRVGGTELRGKHPSEIVRAGVIHVPERRRIFSSLSVEENLVIGAYGWRRGVSQMFRRPGAVLPEVYGLFPLLAERKKQGGGSLSGGEQQMLAIGRGLMARPSLLLLDEPTLGLAPKIAREIMVAVKKLKSQGVTVLIAEEQAKYVMGVADRVVILRNGQVSWRGGQQAFENLGDDLENLLGLRGRVESGELKEGPET